MAVPNPPAAPLLPVHPLTEEPLAVAIPNGNLSRLDRNLYNNLANFEDKALFKTMVLDFVTFAEDPHTTLAILGRDAITQFINLVAGSDHPWGIATPVVPAFRLNRDAIWNNGQGFLHYLRQQADIRKRLPTPEFRAGDNWQRSVYMDHIKNEMDFLGCGKLGPQASEREGADQEAWAKGTTDLFRKIRDYAAGDGPSPVSSLQAQQASRMPPRLDVRFPGYQPTPQLPATSGTVSGPAPQLPTGGLAGI